MDDLTLSRLLTEQVYYADLFMDLALWEATVRSVSERHGFACRSVKPGIAGSFPTFIVKLDDGGIQCDSGMIVVKFFGALFDGHNSYIVEQAMGRYLAQQSLPVCSPAILAEGELTSEWKYLIFEGVSGVGISQVRKQLSQSAWMHVARQMGAFIQALHTTTAKLPPPISISTRALNWDGFVDFLKLQCLKCQDNHQSWNDLPPHLAAQVQDYLLPVEQLVDLTLPPHLIHADLTGDHLLGRKTPTPDSLSAQTAGESWDSLAIIDWGDARIGNILYEIVALYLDLFGADKHLLRICLQQYSMSAFYQADFPRKALGMVLLHQFPMPASIYAPYREAQSLQKLAEGLFSV